MIKIMMYLTTDKGQQYIKTEVDEEILDFLPDNFKKAKFISQELIPYLELALDNFDKADTSSPLVL